VLTDGVSSQRLTDRGAYAVRMAGNAWGKWQPQQARSLHCFKGLGRHLVCSRFSLQRTNQPKPCKNFLCGFSEAGLMRMSQSGAFLVSSEMCLFQLMKVLAPVGRVG
jgi:hypothetical protein